MTKMKSALEGDYACRHNGEFMQRVPGGNWECCACGLKFTDAEYALFSELKQIRYMIERLKK